jgi:hypothetical protein
LFLLSNPLLPLDSGGLIAERILSDGEIERTALDEAGGRMAGITSLTDADIDCRDCRKK